MGFKLLIFQLTVLTVQVMKAIVFTLFGWLFMKSTTSTCTICFSRPTPAKPRDVLHCGCARTAREAPTSEVRLLHRFWKLRCCGECWDEYQWCFVLDLRWVNVQNVEEASKVLRVGNKNRSAAATKMNQSSSRRLNISLIRRICSQDSLFCSITLSAGHFTYT